MTPRDAEIARYVALYREHGSAYRPTAKRLELYRALVAERPDLYGLGLIDVGAGQGDMLDEASRGYYPSTIHRVLNPTGDDAKKSRISLPLFLHPRPDVVLSERHTSGSYLTERLIELGVKK